MESGSERVKKVVSGKTWSIRGDSSTKGLAFFVVGQDLQNNENMTIRLMRTSTLTIAPVNKMEKSRCTHVLSSEKQCFLREAFVEIIFP